MEQLEDRTLPSSYTAGSVSDLITDINAANAAGGANTITLTAPSTLPYALTAANNFTNGGNSLPVIAANDNLTIVGNGDTINAQSVGRLFDVASGASLTLENLTLQGGLAWGTTRWVTGAAADPSSASLYGAAEGGAIYNQGTLVLDGVTVQGNRAGRLHYVLGMGIDAAGGGIFSSGGSVTLEGGTIVKNNGAFGQNTVGGNTYAGNAYGGGLYARGGTVTVTNATLDNNTAEAGNDNSGNSDGYAYGGGLYAYGATVTLTNATLDGNVATANNVNLAFGGGGAFGGGLYLAAGGPSAGGQVLAGTATLTNCTVQGNSALNDERNGHGEGGGIYIYSTETVYLDAATVAQVTGNTASDGAAFDNIVGTYIHL